VSLKAAQEAFSAGRLTGAHIVAVEAMVAAEPENADALQLLGRIRLSQRRQTDAEALLARSAALVSSPSTLLLLAEAQWGLRSYLAYEQTLERLLERNHSRDISPENYCRLAKLKAMRGEVEGARATLRTAMAAFPNNVELVAFHADYAAGDPDRACAEVDTYLSAAERPEYEVSYLLKRRTGYRVRRERKRLGLPADCGVSWEDTRAWADPAGLEQLRAALAAELTTSSVRAGALLDLAFTGVAGGNFRDAENLLAQVRAGVKGTLADFMAFGHEFHSRLDALSDAEIVAGLPPVIDVLNARREGPASLFIAADPIYFQRFTQPFLRQLETAKVACDVHIHLLDGTPEQWTAYARDCAGSNVRLSLSGETSKASKRDNNYGPLYFHSVRFVRFYEFLNRTQRPALLLDADVNLLRDPRPLLARLPDFDLALRSLPAVFEPNGKMMASCVSVSPSPIGLAFAKRVAAYIAFFRQNERWGWGIDQAALFSSYAAFQATGREPRTLFLQTDVVCLNEEATGIFQYPSGIKKYLEPAAT
jgi:tetratricopeptide (TPR) repeat protein